jgi:uridine kinase
MTNPHEKASEEIVSALMNKVRKKQSVFTISLAGESGCGKTETGKALVKELERKGIRALLIGQDNYFLLPPLANDAMRKKDPEWLGPHKEVNLKLLDNNLRNAINGAKTIESPHIDYLSNRETIEHINIDGIKVLIVEGTYTSLLRNIDTRIFIDADYKDTLKFRKLRNRGNEVNDPFVEGILEMEHKIIAGHKFLADIIITKDYEVVPTEDPNKVIAIV